MSGNDEEIALYAQIGRYITQFNGFEAMVRQLFEAAVDTRFGPILGQVQSFSQRIDMLTTALEAVKDQRPWAADALRLMPRLREIVAFRNDLAHGFLAHRPAGGAVLALKMWDTNKKTRLVELSVAELSARNIELDTLLADFLRVITSLIMQALLNHDIKSVEH